MFEESVAKAEEVKTLVPETWGQSVPFNSGHDSTVHGLFIIVLAVYGKVSVSDIDTSTSIKRNCSEVQSVDFANN